MNGVAGPSTNRLEQGMTLLHASRQVSSTPSEAGDSTSTPKRRMRSDLGPKNVHACDRCRRKKTKCLPKDGDRTTCLSCVHGKVICTFDLPLTASRTKRVRNRLSSTGGDGSYLPEEGVKLPSLETTLDRLFDGRGEPRIGVSQRDEGVRDGVGSLGMLADHAVLEPSSSRSRPTAYTPIARPGSTTYKEGCTSLSYILHSAPSFPLYLLHEHDRSPLHLTTLKRHADRQSHLQITRTPPQALEPPSLACTRTPGWADTIQELVQDFLWNVTPIIPIVRETDLLFDGQEGEGDLLRYVMAGVGATSKECPEEVLEALRWIVNTEIKDQDVMSDTSIRSIRILLILALSDDLIVPDTRVAPSVIQRSRISTAIRMMTDLDMEKSDNETHCRIWLCGVIIDTWHAMKAGSQPVHDIPSRQLHWICDHHSPRHSTYRLYSLSCTMIYLHHQLYSSASTGGLLCASTNIGSLAKAKSSIIECKAEAGSDLALTSLASPLVNGLYHLLHTTSLFLLYRPFMRWSFDVEENYTLNLDVRVWEEIHGASTAGLEWVLNLPDPSRLLFFGPYVVGIAAFVQYHHWARRREVSGKIMLERLVKCIDKWVEDGRLTHSKAEMELVRLMHEATEKLGNILPEELGNFERGLDPALGIFNRRKNE